MSSPPRSSNATFGHPVLPQATLISLPTAAPPVSRPAGRPPLSRVNSFRLTSATALQQPAHTVGEMSHVCQFCGALMWSKERAEVRGPPEFSLCCSRGKISLPTLDHPPEPLLSLLSDITARGKHFRDHFRAYNSAFQLASSQAAIDRSIVGGVQQFRISGTVHHLIGPLFPGTADVAKFAQMYVIDNVDEQLAQRHAMMKKLHADIMRDLQRMMIDCNPFVQTFRSAALAYPDTPHVRIIIRSDNVPDRRRYNLPAVPEIAAFIPEPAEPAKHARHIVVQLREGGLHQISELNAAYDPLHFVLLFPRGEMGWDPAIPHAPRQEVPPPSSGSGVPATPSVHTDDAAGGFGDDELRDDSATTEPDRSASIGEGQTSINDEEHDMPSDLTTDDAAVAGVSGESGGPIPRIPPRKRVTVREFAAHRLQVRNVGSAVIQQGCRLSQEYMVTMFCKMENQRLGFIRHNQVRLRSELYQGVQDAIHRGDANPAALGRRIVLPSGHSGSPRHMQQLYQDAMAIVRKCGKPDLFITFTCNPRWKEILEALLPGQRQKGGNSCH